MALQHDIAREVAAGRLNKQWPTSDLIQNRNLSKKYEETTLRTAPANQSISLPGLNLGNGINAKKNNPIYYRRVGKKGRANIYSLAQNVNSPANMRVQPALKAQSRKICGGTPNLTVSNQNMRTRLLKDMVRAMNNDYNWDKRLHSYNWKGHCYFKTQGILHAFTVEGEYLSRLIEANINWSSQDNTRAKKWALSIFEWGGAPRKPKANARNIFEVLSNALCGRVICISAPINSSYSKVAAMGTAYLEGVPNRFPQMIFDSRVATALTSRLDNALVSRNLSDNQKYFPDIGHADRARLGGISRSRKLNWPDMYTKWHGQFAATQIIAEIRDILNADVNLPDMPDGLGGHTKWSMRGVEAVLFMDGA